MGFSVAICLTRQCGRIQKFLEPDRQLTDPDTSSVVDRVGDRCVCSDIAELTETPDAEIIDLPVFFGH